MPLCCIPHCCNNKVTVAVPDYDRTPSRITWLSSSASITSLYKRARYRLPINERDMVLLSASWEGVESSIQKAGVFMFMEMLQNSPHVKPAFQKFMGVDTNQQMAQSTILQTHGLIVMNAINDMICGIDDADDVIDQIMSQGKAHVGFQGMEAEYFWAMEKPFLAAVRSTLRGAMGPKIEGLYKKLIRYVLEVLIVGFKQEKVAQQKLKQEKKKKEKIKRSQKGAVHNLVDSINGGASHIIDNETTQRPGNMLEVPCPNMSGVGNDSSFMASMQQDPKDSEVVAEIGEKRLVTATDRTDINET